MVGFFNLRHNPEVIVVTKKKAAANAKAETPELASPVEPSRGRRLKKIESVRQKTDKINTASGRPKRRRLHKTAGAAFKPFKRLGQLLARLFRPLRFLLWPLKTRPVRFAGRVIAAILFLKFIRNSAREVRTVSWPSRRETIRLTFAVFMFAIVFGMVISLADYGLDKVFKKLLLK